MAKSKLSKIKKGTYFKFEKQKKVFVFDGKVRMYTNTGRYKGFGYEYHPFDDALGDFRQIFKDRTIEIDFEF